jgi:protein gp37
VAQRPVGPDRGNAAPDVAAADEAHRQRDQDAADERLGHVARWNVWLGATIVNQEEADRDVPKLLATPARVRFVSYEPALGPVDWTKFPGIDWIIVGGESTQGAKARFFDMHGARDTIVQAGRSVPPRS